MKHKFKRQAGFTYKRFETPCILIQTSWWHRQTIHRLQTGQGGVKCNLSSSSRLKRVSHQEMWHSVAGSDPPPNTAQSSTHQSSYWQLLLALFFLMSGIFFIGRWNEFMVKHSLGSAQEVMRLKKCPTKEHVGVKDLWRHSSCVAGACLVHVFRAVYFDALPKKLFCSS